MFTPSPEGEGWGEGSILKFPMDCHENLRFSRNDAPIYPFTPFTIGGVILNKDYKLVSPPFGGELC